MTLTEYVQEHAVRGACKCGRCFDAPDDPEQHQPDKNPAFAEHTVDLTFFKVATNIYALREVCLGEFMDLVRKEHPGWLDGKEHSYIEVGAEMGDQGMALLTIGLGHLLGAWEALSPETVMPSMDAEIKMKLAGRGMVTLQYELPR